MQRRNFFIEDDIYAKLETLAGQAQTSVAEQVRSALAFWVAVRQQDQRPDETIQAALAQLDRSDGFWLQIETLKEYYQSREGSLVSLYQIIVDSIELRYKEIRDNQNNRARITHVVQGQAELKQGQAQVVASQGQVVDRLTSVEAELKQAVALLAQLANQHREGEPHDERPSPNS